MRGLHALQRAERVVVISTTVPQGTNSIRRYPMKRYCALLAAVVGVLALWQAAPPVGAQAQQAPTIKIPGQADVKIPEPGVPQIMTLEGLFVRASYNNEGYVILGYKTANIAVGEEWMLLEIGTT